MHDMLTYDFYVKDYMGSQIPEKAFPGLAARAADALAQFERVYRVKDSGEVSRSMALCAMAECIYDDSKHRGIQSANVGSVKIQYNEKTPRKYLSRLYDSAAIYLDICRGVE